MNEIIKTLPLAAYLAILLFVLKEVLEFIKNKKSINRKKSAFRLLISQELERNNLSFQIIFGTIDDLLIISKDFLNEPKKPIVKVLVKNDGTFEYNRKYNPEDSFSTKWTIPTVKKEVYNKLLPEIAEVDKKLFSHVSETYTKVGELDHIRKGIYEYTMEEDNKQYLEGFPEYALTKKEEILKSLENLYFICTKKKLKNVKVY